LYNQLLLPLWAGWPGKAAGFPVIARLIAAASPVLSLNQGARRTQCHYSA
jgi:hypothetical protein